MSDLDARQRYAAIVHRTQRHAGDEVCDRDLVTADAIFDTREVMARRLDVIARQDLHINTNPHYSQGWRDALRFLARALRSDK